jgi:hypothetical protein
VIPVDELALLYANSRLDGTPILMVDRILRGGVHETANVFAGMAVNRTDSTLTDMVIALVVEVEKSGRYSRIGSRDTLEYAVARVAPHAVIGFAGGYRMPTPTDSVSAKHRARVLAAAAASEV